MRIIEPGHVYELNWLDAHVDVPNKFLNNAAYLLFVNREKGTDAPSVGSFRQRR